MGETGSCMSKAGSEAIRAERPHHDIGALDTDGHRGAEEVRDWHAFQCPRVQVGPPRQSRLQVLAPAVKMPSMSRARFLATWDLSEPSPPRLSRGTARRRRQQLYTVQCSGVKLCHSSWHDACMRHC